MQTYTSRRNRFGDLCNNSSATVLTLADSLMNASEKSIISAKDWDFLWRQYTKLTVAGESTIKLPAYTRKPQGIYVTVGSYRYSPKEVTNRFDWDRLKITSISSDIPTHYFVYDGSIELFPTPSSSNNVVTFNARRIARDLSLADYTTGSITTIATSGIITTVTGSGTSWEDGMIGMSIRVTPTTATKGGDGIWYEIATVPSTTTLTLVRTYGGTQIATATANYIIGETSLIPEPHDMLPVFRSLETYFTSVEPNASRAELYGTMYKEGYQEMVQDHGATRNVVINDIDDDLLNPNLYVTL